jgi:hypothetical protein
MKNANIVKLINSLKYQEELEIMYNNDRYTARCFHISSITGLSCLALKNSYDEMIISTLDDESINLFNIDMMGAKTFYNMKVDKITLVK